ncbi:hypothetical protein B0J15DRAFT_458642 [Fusarium solani]|uniref:Uncharacterized protein n=1 Tax=Fusarium solani TaxID=169388 RepID=A0A9P9L3G6_FUSSL|nr:uncharacterized protein B0J15DRAFT_458642 [Fusarium solani]KAH7273539.1 hypothetical protein B0J15DRAFT_458642 [Fusarium solani]
MEGEGRGGARLWRVGNVAERASRELRTSQGESPKPCAHTPSVSGTGSRAFYETDTLDRLCNCQCLALKTEPNPRRWQGRERKSRFAHPTRAVMVDRERWREATEGSKIKSAVNDGNNPDLTGNKNPEEPELEGRHAPVPMASQRQWTIGNAARWVPGGQGPFGVVCSGAEAEAETDWIGQEALRPKSCSCCPSVVDRASTLTVPEAMTESADCTWPRSRVRGRSIILRGPFGVHRSQDRQRRKKKGAPVTSRTVLGCAAERTDEGEREAKQTNDGRRQPRRKGWHRTVLLLNPGTETVDKRGQKGSQTRSRYAEQNWWLHNLAWRRPADCLVILWEEKEVLYRTAPRRATTSPTDQPSKEKSCLLGKHTHTHTQQTPRVSKKTVGFCTLPGVGQQDTQGKAHAGQRPKSSAAAVGSRKFTPSASLAPGPRMRPNSWRYVVAVAASRPGGNRVGTVCAAQTDTDILSRGLGRGQVATRVVLRLAQLREGRRSHAEKGKNPGSSTAQVPDACRYSVVAGRDTRENDSENGSQRHD